jgi:protein-tyrosine phosphatase
MDFGSDIINISKIKDSFFIGDKISGTNLDVLIQFKISHILNTSGTEILNYFESIGVEYLTLNWVESPSQILLDSNEQIVDKIMRFIAESLSRGEGLLIISVKGKNRCCIVVVIYLMKKYNWSVDKCIQFIKSKKEDIEIEPYFVEQLKEYEKKLNIKTNTWKDISNKENDENLLRNTYVNGLPVKQLDSIGIDFIDNNKMNEKVNKKKNVHINWAERDKLVTLNYEKDLIFQDDIKEINCHMTLKPGKSSIKQTKDKDNIMNKVHIENNKTNNNENNNINVPVQVKKKLKIRADVDFNKINSEYNNISPNIIKQLIENDSFYFLPSNKNLQNNNLKQYKTRTNKSITNKFKRPSSLDNNRNKNKLKKEIEKNDPREVYKSTNNEDLNNFKSYSLNKNNLNLMQKRIYNSNNDISKNNNYLNEEKNMRKLLEDNKHINKLLYSLNNKNKMEYLINNFTNYNNNINSDAQIKKIYNNFMNRNNICSSAFSLTNSTRHSNFVPEIKNNKSKKIFNF